MPATTGGFKRAAVNKDGNDRELYAKQLLTEAVQFWFPFPGFLAVGCCGWAGKVIYLTPTLKPDFDAIGWDWFRLPARGQSWTDDYQWWSTQLVLALRNLCAGSPEVCSVSLCER